MENETYELKEKGIFVKDLLFNDLEKNLISDFSGVQKNKVTS